MVMSTKKIVRGIDESLNKAVSEINASTPKPDMKDAGAELKAATAGKNDLSFAEQFKYTRMAAKAAGLDPSKQTFTWKGKTYTTKMAGEGAKRAAPARRSESPATNTGTKAGAATPPANTGTKSGAATPPATTGTKAGAATPPVKMDTRYLGAKIPAPAPTPKDSLTANIERRNKLVAPKREPTRAERMKAESIANVAAWKAKQAAEAKAEADAERAAKARRDAMTRQRFAEATRGGSPLRAMAKGGKIDGCAVRGKTRAMRKK